jgi:hypothetical protein
MNSRPREDDYYRRAAQPVALDLPVRLHELRPHLRLRLFDAGY